MKVIFMPEGDAHHMGGTMRLGARCTAIALAYSAQELSPPTVAASVYGLSRPALAENDQISIPPSGTGIIWERHRHRYGLDRICTLIYWTVS